MCNASPAYRIGKALVTFLTSFHISVLFISLFPPPTLYNEYLMAAKAVRQGKFTKLKELHILPQWGEMSQYLPP
jgi:hypothetical protein